MTEDEQLIQLKLLLGIDSTDEKKDDILKFILKRVTARILSYCGLEVIPEGLETTVMSMAIEGYRQLNLGKENYDSEAQSIKRGDTTVTYKTPIEILNQWISKPTLLNDYTQELNQYRKVRFF